MINHKYTLPYRWKIIIETVDLGFTRNDFKKDTELVHSLNQYKETKND